VSSSAVFIQLVPASSGRSVHRYTIRTTLSYCHTRARARTHTRTHAPTHPHTHTHTHTYATFRNFWRHANCLLVGLFYFEPNCMSQCNTIQTVRTLNSAPSSWYGDYSSQAITQHIPTPKPSTAGQTAIQWWDLIAPGTQICHQAHFRPFIIPRFRDFTVLKQRCTTHCVCTCSLVPCCAHRLYLAITQLAAWTQVLLLVICEVWV
jgi:hypothetical protein